MRQALLLRHTSPLSFPLFRSTPPPCPTCVRRRTLSTTAPLSVFRPQEPYEFPKPRLDSLGKPITTRRRLIDESSEEDALWDQQVKESGKPDPIEQMLAEMAEPTRKGFYERYGSHDGYGLRNKQRWRMGEDGKLEPWDGAGANWKETLGFRPNLPRPGRRVEVPGFQHRKSPKLEVNGRGRYVQVEGGSWGVKKAISGSSGYGVDSDRVEAGDGQGIVGRRSDEIREMKREWTGESDFLRADDDLVQPYHRTRRQDLPRPLPPHLDAQNDREVGQVRTTPSSTTSSSFFNDPASDPSTDRPSSSVRQGRPPRLSFSDRNITSGTPTPRLPNASTADIEGYQNRSARAPRLPRTFGVRHYTSGPGFAMPPKLKTPTRPATSTSPSQSNTPSASASRPDALKVEGDNGPAPLNASQTPATYSNSRKHPGGWSPTKKLTYAAMAGLRELHAIDPKQYDKFFLAKKFGIHQESVRRILKSKWRERGGENITHTEGKPATERTAGKAVEKKSLRGTKWDVSPDTGREASPVHALKQVRRE